MRTMSLAGLFVAIVAFSGCNGNSGSTTPTAPVQTAGEYTGTATDSVFGNGTAAVTLSQKASSIGGTLNTTFGTTTIANALAVTIDGSGNLSGSAVATVNPSQPTCGFTVTGTYNSSTGALNGSYAAYSGCASETGTFTLTQQCTDPSIPSAVARRRPDAAHGVLPC